MLRIRELNIEIEAFIGDPVSKEKSFQQISS
jgi:hypothetical protein